MQGFTRHCICGWWGRSEVVECGGAASVGLRARLAAQTERSGTAGDHSKMRFLCRHDAVTALLLFGCSATGGSRQQAKPAERRCPTAMPGNEPCCYKASETRRKPSPAVMHGAKAGQAGSNEPSGAMQSGMLFLCRQREARARSVRNKPAFGAFFPEQ